jgi:hypothetical protein
MRISTMLADRRSATMTSHENRGFLHRMLIALGRALRRGILGKSGHDYMKQFSASDVYWEREIAAQLGWPQRQPAKSDPGRFRSSGDAVVRAPDSDYEPVHGWTKRQCDDYLARNPGYRSTYETELQERCYAAAAGVNGRSHDWFGLRRIDHDKPQATPSQIDVPSPAG